MYVEDQRRSHTTELTSEEHKYRRGSRTFNVQKPLLHIWRCRHEYNPLSQTSYPALLHALSLSLSLFLCIYIYIYTHIHNHCVCVCMCSLRLLSHYVYSAREEYLRKFHPVLHSGSSSRFSLTQSLVGIGGGCCRVVWCISQSLFLDKGSTTFAGELVSINSPSSHRYQKSFRRDKKQFCKIWKKS